MLKLPGVSKFSNGWQYHPKRKYQTKKRSFTIKHKKALLNLRHFFRELVWMANLSIENHHWHLHESKSYVLVPGKSEWARTWNKRKLKKLSPSTSGHGTISSIYYPSSLLINVTSPHIDWTRWPSVRFIFINLDPLPNSGLTRNTLKFFIFTLVYCLHLWKYSSLGVFFLSQIALREMKKSELLPGPVSACW